MIRSLIVPGILLAIVSLPFVLPSENETPSTAVENNRSSDPAWSLYGNSARPVGTAGASSSPFMLGSARRDIGQSVPANFVSSQTAPSGIPIDRSNGNPSYASNPASTNDLVIVPQQTAFANSPVYDERGYVIGFAPDPVGGQSSAIDPAIFGMTPDYGAAQTFYLPGDASGPNLSAQPIGFVPVTNFAEIFRFDATPQWIRGRWDRVSTTPRESGLSGYRVALVTGTNSWDLHGSLTYYFDANQRCQRVTFRGWSGDAAKLIDLLQKNHGFVSQPTSEAGFYVAKKRRTVTGGLLMKNPTVMYAENKVQQVALVLEINAPDSNLGLSEDFMSLIRGSQGNP